MIYPFLPVGFGGPALGKGRLLIRRTAGPSFEHAAAKQVQNGFIEIVLVGKIVIEGTLAHPASGDDPVQRGLLIAPICNSSVAI